MQTDWLCAFPGSIYDNRTISYHVRVVNITYHLTLSTAILFPP